MVKKKWLIVLVFIAAIFVVGFSNTTTVDAATWHMGSFTVPKKFRGNWRNYAGTAMTGVSKIFKNHESKKIKAHSINGEKKLFFTTYNHGRAFEIAGDYQGDIERFHLTKLNGHAALVVTEASMIGIYRKNTRTAKKYVRSDRKWLSHHKKFNPFSGYLRLN